MEHQGDDIRLRDWLTQRRSENGLHVEPIGLAQSREWSLTDGRLMHRSGGFFSVTGLAWSLEGGPSGEQPIILQPEIGILGFVVRRAGRGWQWLLQAKAEPGNTGEVQLAPTVQATVSNYTRRHGGLPTPYLELFLDEDGERVSDSLQSEQGSRFLGKYNRNMVVATPDAGLEPVSEDWHWANGREVQAMLLCDFAINTDARSVITCTDWRLLCEGTPFAAGRPGDKGFSAQLLASHGCDDNAAEQDLNAILQALQHCRDSTRLTTRLKPLQALAGWHWSDTGLTPAAGGSIALRYLKVDAAHREVPHWDQPILAGLRQESTTLLCQCRRGVLHFLLRCSVEVGFRETAQFGPTLQSDALDTDPAWRETLTAVTDTAVIRAAVRQSDEGGRFDHAVTEYRIAQLDAACTVPASPLAVWVTLRQIETMCRQQGLLSNELRSAVSLLLAFA